MKCYDHNENDSIWTCANCWAWLCKECFYKYSGPICDNCNKEALIQDISYYNNLLVKYFAIWIILSLFFLNWMTSDIHFEYNLQWIFWIILLFYVTVFVCFWRSYLNSLKDPNKVEITINDSWIWFIIRKLIKLWLALLIWWFVWPFQLRKILKDRKMKKDTLELINNN